MRLTTASADFEAADQKHTDAHIHESVFAAREQLLKEAFEVAEAALHVAFRAGRERATAEVQQAEQLTAIDLRHQERESSLQGSCPAHQPSMPSQGRWAAGD